MRFTENMSEVDLKSNKTCNEQPCTCKMMVVCANCVHHKIVKMKESNYHGDGWFWWTKHECRNDQKRRVIHDHVLGDHAYIYLQCIDVNRDGMCDGYEFQKNTTIAEFNADNA